MAKPMSDQQPGEAGGRALRIAHIRKRNGLALAAAWASIDGKLESFGKEATDEALADTAGHREGYLIEADELLVRLERRGFTLTRFVNPVRPAAA